MNIWQVGSVVRPDVSALVVAFLSGYATHHQWGLSRSTLRTGALSRIVLAAASVNLHYVGRDRCGDAPASLTSAAMDPIQTFNTRPSNVCVAVTASARKDNLLSENCAARDRRRLARDLGHACPPVVNRQPSGFVFRGGRCRTARKILD